MDIVEKIAYVNRKTHYNPCKEPLSKKLVILKLTTTIDKEKIEHSFNICIKNWYWNVN